MKSVTSAEMRELDRRTIEEFGTPGEVLMERAGQGLADSILRRQGWLGPRCRAVTIVAGKGNNGGDACVAARLLKETGVPVQLYTTCLPQDYKGDAAVHFRRMSESGVPVKSMTEEKDWLSRELDCKGRIIIDGLLGTGTRGAARGTAEAAIKWINSMKQENAVAAIDVPSGLNADSGASDGETVRAEWTVTMGMPKRGLIAPCAFEYVGNLEVVDIGIPEDYTKSAGTGPSLLSRDEMARLLPPRRAASHKGSHGSVLILAGSCSFPGAAVLCAMGGVRSGAGLVKVITTENAAAALSAAVPEAIVRGVRADGNGAMLREGVAEAAAGLSGYNSVVVGPGMMNTDTAGEVVEWVLSSVDCPVLLDADALNAAAGSSMDLMSTRRDIVITPHPGEAGRLAGLSAREIQADRLASLRLLKKRHGGVVVLKGAGTLIASESGEWINMTGNAGMAKGGSGDVLAGLVGGLLAQDVSPDAAACLGVYLHGMAGDIAASRGSVRGMTAGDTALCIAEAFSSLE